MRFNSNLFKIIYIYVNLIKKTINIMKTNPLKLKFVPLDRRQVHEVGALGGHSGFPALGHIENIHIAFGVFRPCAHSKENQLLSA